MAVALLIPWVYRYGKDVPQWPCLDDRILSSAGLDRDRLYFTFLSAEDVKSVDADNGLRRRFANTPLYAGIKFVNGYTAMPTDAMVRLLHMAHNGFVSAADARLLEREVGPDGLFNLMGVEGIVLGRDYLYLAKELEGKGWEVVRSSVNEMLLHRRGPRLGLHGGYRDHFGGDVDALVDHIQNRGAIRPPLPSC